VSGPTIPMTPARMAGKLLHTEKAHLDSSCESLDRQLAQNKINMDTHREAVGILIERYERKIEDARKQLASAEWGSDDDGA
jgi:HPt (histidine-containing phosphotransfer) domain-containing protein